MPVQGIWATSMETTKYSDSASATRWRTGSAAVAASFASTASAVGPPLSYSARASMAA